MLGFSCSHAYPQASEYDRSQLPEALKGADLVLYSIFRSLGIEVAILPILEKDGRYGIENQDLGIQGDISEWEESYDAECLMDCLENGGAEHMDFNESQLKPLITDGLADLDRCWKLLLMTRRITGMHELREYARENNLPLNSNTFYDQPSSLVGSRVRPYTVSDYEVGEMMEFDEVSIQRCPSVYG